MSDQLPDKFVVGLGNPGSRYEKTRHNVGFRVVDDLVDRWQLGKGKGAFGGEFFEARRTVGDELQKVKLLKPHTYMNRSGKAVRQMADFFKAQGSEILIVLDDIDLPPDRLRVRASGSAGGHKGLADILEVLGTQDVPRLRIGVGAPPSYMDAADFVLQKIEDKAAEEIEISVKTAADAVEDWIVKNELLFVMEKYNRKADS